jgi:glyoxylase-like metal-dependent hydrolase (beta-lactamase superfamily II)
MDTLMTSLLLSRRRFVATAVAAAGATRFCHSVLQAQDIPDVLARGRAAGAIATIKTQNLRGNVSVMMGVGGNIAVLPGKDGKLLIDSGYATAQPHLTEALAAISSDPITHLINTHWHFDHTDGNEWVHAAGATIIAHENCRTRLSTPQEIVAYKAKFPPSPAGAIPTLVFKTDDTLKLNGANLTLRHYDPAHTDTDLSVYFAEANVLHTGDTFWNPLYPFIDYSSGGNIDGMILANKNNLDIASADTIIIPGHGAVGTKAQLIEFHEMLVGVRDNVAKLKKEGKSLDETIAAKPTAAFDEKFGAPRAPAFIGYVYQGV